MVAYYYEDHYETNKKKLDLKDKYLTFFHPGANGEAVQGMVVLK